MIKDPKSLLISIAIHILVLTSTLYVWDNYVRTPNKQSNNETKPKQSTAINTQKDITPIKEEVQKQTKIEPKQEVIPQSISEEKQKSIVEKPIIAKTVTKTKEKQAVKKYNLEPVKMGNFLVEQVPEELLYIGKNAVKGTINAKEQKLKQQKLKKQKLKQQKIKEQKLKQQKLKKQKLKKQKLKKQKLKKQKLKKQKLKKQKLKQQKIKEQKLKQQKLKEQKPKQEKVKEQKSYVKTYLKVNEISISKLLKKHLFYPSSLKKKGITGEIIVKFKLNSNKKIYDIKVVKSSNKMLSRVAMKTISDLSGKLPKPKQNIILHLPIKYE